MKKQKKIKRYCPKCRKHTEQEVSLAKGTRKRSSLSKGSLQRARKRGLARGYGNLGKYGSKPAISKWKRTGSKISKKQDLRYKCKACNKIFVQKKGKRAKRMELK